MKKLRTTCLILGFSFIFIISVNAAENAGVYFNDRYQDEGVELALKGTGLKSVYFFKAFVAGLYTNEEANEQMLGKFPKRIEVEYFVSIPAYKMNDFTVKSMKENITRKEFEYIGNEIVQMGQYFVDLEPGDRYSLTFIPGIGTKFVHNGRLVGTIEGEIFAKALFSTWLGNRPFDKKLKNEILGPDRSQKASDRKTIARFNG